MVAGSCFFIIILGLMGVIGWCAATLGGQVVPLLICPDCPFTHIVA